MINPLIYRIVCSSCGGLSTLPLDIAQTKILSNNEKITISYQEIKWMLFIPLIFSLQNTVYSQTSFIKNQSLRGILSGLAASPPYIIIEIKKMQNRLNLLPNYKKIIFWFTLREIIVYICIYNLYNLKIPFSNFIAALIANSFGFPLKIIAFKQSFPTLKINSSTIKKTAILEILKSAIGDGITLYLIYNFKYSPIKYY